MANASLKFGNAIVCEHVAEGSGNRPVLINVFSGDIIVSELPARINIAFYVEVFQRIEGGTVSVELKIDKATAATFTLDVPSGVNDPVGIIKIPSGILAIERASDISLWVTVPGFKKSCALRKAVRLAP